MKEVDTSPFNIHLKGSYGVLEAGTIWMTCIPALSRESLTEMRAARESSASSTQPLPGDERFLMATLGSATQITAFVCLAQTAEVSGICLVPFLLS